jgi:dihydrofolate reductase
VSTSPGAPGTGKPKLILIVAMARNRVIGKDGDLPWRLPEDLKRFRSLTMGHPIIMGRKTYDSIGRALPGRRNIVISRQQDLRIDGVETTSSLAAALEMTTEADKVFVIGGQQIYLAALPVADRIELTQIDKDFDGDVLFPEISPAQWQQSGEQPGQESGNGFEYRFITLERTAAP